MCNVVQKYEENEETGSIGNGISRVHHSGLRSAKNIAPVTDNVAQGKIIDSRSFT